MRIQAEILAVGEALIDLVAPTAPDLTAASEYVRAAGGAPANVAVAAARLGVSSGLIGALGDDPFGRYLRTLLEQERLVLDGLKTVPERTTLAFVAKNDGGIPDFVFYRGADAAMTPEDIPEELIAETHLLHASSMALMSEPSSSATLHAVELAQAAGVTVSVDPNLRPSSWPSERSMCRAVEPLIEAAQILKVNETEAAILTGYERPEEAADALARADRLVVVTLGSSGVLWRWQYRGGRVAAPLVVATDTTGAGDAFVGALLAELCVRGYSRQRFAELPEEELMAALRFACAAGALACTRPGAIPALPTRSEVETMLSEWP